MSSSKFLSIQELLLRISFDMSQLDLAWCIDVYLRTFTEAHDGDDRVITNEDFVAFGGR